jgi:hypothetical protein
MRIFIRILVGLFALAGGVAWTVLLGGVAQFGMAMGGAGDGAGTANGSDPVGTLLAGIIWLVPMAGFVFMLLGALDVLKGTLRRVGYWYALFFLLIATVVLLLLYPGVRILKWIGLACLLMAVLWGYAFRQKAGAGADGSTV